EFTVGLEPVRGNLLTWYTQFHLSRNRNIVVKLGPGVEPFYPEYTSSRRGVRVAPGYPLHGRWAAPVLGYADANGDGVLDQNEIVMGDTLVYVGGTLPNYMAALSTNFSILRGILAVNMGFEYQNGMTQSN